MPQLIDKIITEDGLFAAQQCSRVQFDYYLQQIKESGWKLTRISPSQVIATYPIKTADGRTMIRYIALAEGEK